MALPFVLWRPPEFLVEREEELAEWETTMVKLEVKDVEFEEDRVEVVRLVVNCHQLSSSGWTLTRSKEVAGTEGYDLAYEHVYDVEFDATPS